VKARHPDDFALLRYTAGDLDESEHGSIVRHLDECEVCLITLAEIRPLDAALRRIGMERAPARDGDDEATFAPDDPFRQRRQSTPETSPVSRELTERALDHAQRADAEVGALLAAIAESPRAASEYLGRLSFADPATRYLVLYALEEAMSRTSETPAAFLRFAEEVLARALPQAAPRTEERSEAERIVPMSTVAGQAHLLAGQAANWTGELEKARSHLETAYRSFPGDGVNDEIRLALTEYQESQRRSFAGRPGEGLALARRARSTFDELGLEDYAVRSRVAEGIALSGLGRDEEATGHFRAAIGIFERERLWKNYLSAINSLGVSLVRLGRLDDARREYSRALRKLSREKHASLLAFTRLGLAEVLESAGRHADAAKSFQQAARAFDAVGLAGDAVTASLREIESWARSGDTARALHRLGIFRATVERLGALDPFIVSQLEDAVSGSSGFERLGELCRNAEDTIREALRSRAG
jgi:tetratricopeptide (TPR) repeat protein